MNRTTFLAKFGAVYEHSPWVAEAVFDAAADSLPDEAESLGERFKSVFMEADPELQLATLQSHPQLVCALAEPVDLTIESVSEQTGAGLDQCSDAELAEFSRLNAAYMEKFGFPFIIAVRGRDRYKILNLFRMRLQNDAVLEYQTALLQVCQIASFRIRDILDV
ncbi:MAG: 2-oxo-4-hydroxy-4-carboxy-5-ureidoimidazoline decarboxylase [Gammaproteobacteria bacterium]|nr:2-oxo-4-hydroxy-4-carboxy-5-ureidoimidazoline decarboxylase [Gammaproteobacteria bacterium]